MVTPLHSDAARNTLMAAGVSDDLASRSTSSRPGVLPVLPQAPGRITVLCPPEHVAYVEMEIVAPLVQAGFHVTLGPIPADLAPGELPEIPDPNCRLVLLDTAPQDPRSYALCAELRDRLGLPLILVLRGASSDDLLRGYEAGADTCLLAPFDTREFLARLAALLRRQPGRAPHSQPTE